MGYFGMGLSQGIQQGQERKRQRELLDLQKKQLTAQATQMDVENEFTKLQVSALGEKLKAEAALPEAMAGSGGPPPAPLAPGAQGPVPPADFQPPLDMQRLRSLGLMAQRAGYDPAQLFQTMALADPRIRQVLQGKQLIHLKPDETLGQLSPEGQFTTLATGVQKPKVPSFGDAVESVSSELFNLPFTDLNQPQKESVNQTIQARKMEAKGFGDTVESVSSELFDSSFAGLSQAQKARVNQTVQARKVDVAGSAEIMKHNIVREQPLGKEHDNWLDPETLLPAPANLKTGQANERFVHIDNQQKPAIAQIRSTAADLARLEELGNTVLRKYYGKSLRDVPASLAQTINLNTKQFSGDPTVQEMNSIVTRLTVPLAKLQGDTANVAVSEREMIGSSIFSTQDTVESLRAKLLRLRLSIARTMDGMGLAGSAFIADTLPVGKITMPPGFTADQQRAYTRAYKRKQFQIMSGTP